MLRQQRLMSTLLCIHATIFNNGSIILPSFKFTELAAALWTSNICYKSCMTFQYLFNFLWTQSSSISPQVWGYLNQLQDSSATNPVSSTYEVSEILTVYSFSVQRELKSCTELCSVCMSLISSKVWTRLEIFVMAETEDVLILWGKTEYFTAYAEWLPGVWLRHSVPLVQCI